MNIFRRALRFFLIVLGLLVGFVLAAAAFFARYLIRPPREAVWATPDEIGLPYETVQFPAEDGIRLAGWFIPAPADSTRQGAAIVLVHGWPWNRLGTAAVDMFAKLSGNLALDFLRLAHALHLDGYHVLMFDLRNHGESAAAPPVTFGWQEANDVLGAVGYLNGRSEVDSGRIGVVGFSMGANALLHALPQTGLIQAGVAVQPTSAAVFAARYATDLLGPLGKLVLPVTEMIYKANGGPAFNALQPAFAVAGAGKTPVLFIQGTGDRWGSPEDVAEMAQATLGASGPLLIDTFHRFAGYQYAIDNPLVLSAFFEQHLPE